VRPEELNRLSAWFEDYVASYRGFGGRTSDSAQLKWDHTKRVQAETDLLVRGPGVGGFSRKRQERDHQPSFLFGPLLDVLTRREQGMIQRGVALPFGSSWLAVATRS
jgi:hypothetical protein